MGWEGNAAVVVPQVSCRTQRCTVAPSTARPRGRLAVSGRPDAPHRPPPLAPSLRRRRDAGVRGRQKPLCCTCRPNMRTHTPHARRHPACRRANRTHTGGSSGSRAPACRAVCSVRTRPHVVRVARRSWWEDGLELIELREDSQDPKHLPRARQNAAWPPQGRPAVSSLARPF